MKKIIIIILLLKGFTINAQIDFNQRHFATFVYNCLDSFSIKNNIKYKEIKGIIIVTNKDGKLLSYKISFSTKEIQLSKKEYRWIFNLLKKGNYKEYQKFFNTDEELKSYKDVKYGIRFIPKGKRDE